jgi:ABC-type nitrate/sulfonate/bicarbonate transport system permease component
MDKSLLSSLWVTLVQITIALCLSTAIGLLVGWVCAKTNQSAEIYKKVFRFLSYSTVIVPTILLLSINFKIPAFTTAVFLCSFCFVALYATIGIQNAKQNQNQWYLAIPSISLGMRMGLLLSWSMLQIDSLNSQAGVSFFLWDAYNSGDSESIVFGLLGVVTLAFLLDQLIDISGILLSKTLNPQRNGNTSP